MKVTVECSRCHEKVDGIIDEGVTGGFYSVKEGSGWELYADVDEEIICDDCMHKDYRYRSVYNGELLADLEELLDLAKLGLTVSFTTNINDEYVVCIKDYYKGWLEAEVAESVSKFRDVAINHAYLQWMRWADKKSF